MLINLYKNRTIKILLCFLLTVMVINIAGCSKFKGEGKKVVLTTGFSKNEVFRMGDMSCTLPEIMVYLTNIQNQYESVYGTAIWDTTIDGVSLEENVKDMALSKMAQVKAINLLAREYNIEPDEKKEAEILEATEAYYSSLNDKEIELMGIDKDVIYELYHEYALSELLYQEIIKDITPEISDDEARTITVEHILIKTYNLDENKERHPYTEHAKRLAYQKAEEVLKLAQAGENFEQLASTYSEDKTLTYSFGKGEMDAVFENAAFNLGTDEISDIVETEYGYHIIKCVSTFNREETDANKIKLLEKRREEVFLEKYNSFAETITKNLNEDLWSKVRFISDKEVTTSDFFEIFDEYVADK